ncbi:MAG TPA: ester cyclase [Vicinamibacterales bacterium]|nr:ester cyclase [Vicinamibacterales bacterium]
MTREAIEDLVGAREQLWRRRDAAGLAKAHAEDGVVDSPIFGTVRGRAAIEASYAELFRGFGDSSIQLEGLIIDGDRSVQQFSWHATHTHEMFGLPATGRQFTVHGVLIYEFKDGHIAHERRIYDFTGLLVQIGVLKPRPA